jgi:hypothetical protein
MKTTNNHDPRPAWIELAEARLHLNDLIRRQNGIIERTEDCARDTQRDLARMIQRDLSDPNDPFSGNRIKENIERTNRHMAEYQADIDRHTALRDAYRVAAAIIDAVSGAYFYAALKGYYGTQIRKFSSAEELAAFLEENTNWHEANSDDMNQIFWGNEIPEEYTPEA